MIRYQKGGIKGGLEVWGLQLGDMINTKGKPILVMLAYIYFY